MAPRNVPPHGRIDPDCRTISRALRSGLSTKAAIVGVALVSFWAGCSKKASVTELGPNGCPVGCELMGSSPPSGTMQWCQKKDRQGDLVKNGRYREWYPNGQLQSEAHFNDDYLDGVVMNWSQDGRKNMAFTLRKGVLLKVSKYNDNGEHYMDLVVRDEALRKATPIRGIQASRILDVAEDGIGVFFDEKDAKVASLDNSARFVTLFADGKEFCSGSLKTASFKDLCPDKLNTAEFTHAINTMMAGLAQAKSH